jgi:WD40 repeat protein
MMSGTTVAKFTDDQGSSILCPISQDTMRDPVIAADGFSYERSSISKWIDSCSQQGKTVISPMSGEPLASLHLLPNHSLRTMIQDLLSQNPDLHKRAASEAKADDSHSDVGVKRNLGSSGGRGGSGELSCPECRGRGCSFCAASSVGGAVAAIPVEGAVLVGRNAHSWQQGFVSASFSDLYNNTPGLLYHWSREPRADKWTYADITQHAAGNRHADTITSLSVLHSWRAQGASDVHSRLLLSGSRDRTVKVWEHSPGAETGAGQQGVGATDVTEMWRLQQTLTGHTDWVNCVASLAPRPHTKDSALVASGSRDKSLRLWCEGGDERPRGSAGGAEEGWWCASVLKGAQLGEEGGHKDFVTSASLSRAGGGALLASGGADWEVILWDVEYGSCSGPLRNLSGHSYAVRCVAFQSASASSVCSSASCFMGPAALAGANCGEAGGDAGYFGHLLASGSDDETVRTWDPRAKYGGRLETLGCGSAVLCCCFGGGEAGWLAAGGGTPLDSMTASSDNTGGWLRVWDVRTWKPIDCSVMQHTTERSRSNVDGGAVAAGPELTADWEGSVQQHRRAHTAFVSACCAIGTEEGDVLASSGDDKVIRVWRVPRVSALAAGGHVQLAEVELLLSLRGHQASVPSIAAL